MARLAHGPYLSASGGRNRSGISERIGEAKSNGIDSVLRATGDSAGEDLGERVLGDRHAERADFLEPLPGAGDEGLAFSHRGGIEFGLTEQPLDNHRLERGVDDELGHHRIAAEVPLGSRQQLAGLDLPEDEPQVQITPLDEFHFVATDFTEVALIALCHVCECFV